MHPAQLVRRALSAALLLCAALPNVRAQEPRPPKDVSKEHPATLKPGAPAPRYPRDLWSANVTGTVLAMFVLDTTGRADVRSLKIVRATRPEFVDAVKESLPRLEFAPAEVGGRRVKQLVQVVYRFNTASNPARDSVAASTNVATFEIVVTGSDSRLPEQAPAAFAAPAATEPPLYILDGQPSNAAQVQNLAKERIASVDVLKGEAARAKYGEAGRHGVIIITTKP